MKRFVYDLDGSKASAEAFINALDPESVEFVQNYLDEVNDLVVVEFRRGDFVEVSSDNMKQEIRNEYLQIGAGEGYIDSADEFNTICRALTILNS